MSGDELAGVVFPATADGRRSTSALGRAVTADALRGVDPAGALDAERDTNWRTGYVQHFRRLVEAGLPSRKAAMSVAHDGLGSLHRRMRVTDSGGGEAGLDTLLSAPGHQRITTVTVPGTGQAPGSLSLPYHGAQLRGDALLRQMDAWADGGVIEPSCADAIRTVASHPEWLRLPGRTIAMLGAAAEVGPLAPLLGWGARVIAVNLPRPAIWESILDTARRSAGTLLVPVVADQAGPPEAGSGGKALAQRAGLDLTSALPDAADWLAAMDGPLVLGNYVYADGAANVRLGSAVDALTVRLQAARGDTALAFLATPTDVFAVPADAVAQSVRAYATRSRAAKLAGRPLRELSGGRLLRRAYMPGVNPGINDSLIPQQGPNYALAKRVHRWRATLARDARHDRVAERRPADPDQVGAEEPGASGGVRGRSPVRRRSIQPATCRVLMAALLAHDLHTGGGQAHPHPWQDEAHAAAHGGLWRIAYAPRSVLGLAAALGFTAALK